MAIVNITPDSFYDGGKYGTVGNILKDIEEKIRNGAAIVDLGSASSRPGAMEITDQEEGDRVNKVLPHVRTEFP